MHCFDSTGYHTKRNEVCPVVQASHHNSFMSELQRVAVAITPVPWLVGKPSV